MPRLINRSIFILVILNLSLCGNSFCDTVVLKSGKKIEGKIQEKTSEYIKIDYNGMLLYYELKYVNYFIFDKDVEARALELKQKQEEAPDYFLNTSIEYIARGNFADAKKELRKVIDANRGDADLYACLKIIDDLDEETVSPDYVIALYKGLFYITTKQFSISLTELQKAASLDPKQPEAYYHLGVACYSLGRREEAIGYFKKTLELKPDDVETIYDLGFIYYSSGDFKESISYLQKVLQLSPDYADAYYVMGFAYYYLGKPLEAKESLGRARSLLKDSGDSQKIKEIDNLLGPRPSETN